MIRALIPAAGRGARAYPKTAHAPKVMLEVDGKPLIQRNLEILRDQLDIRDVTIIIGHQGEQIQQYLGDGRGLGLTLRYVPCPDPTVGLARGMLLAADHFTDPFVTILGDELYFDSNHHRLRGAMSAGCEAVCAVKPTSDLHQIKRNYSVQIEGSSITRLVEKPETVSNNWLGCGTYIFTPSIFDTIRATPPSPRSGRVELTDAINGLAASAPCVKPFYLEGQYYNINTADDYNYAQYMVRKSRFSQYRTSVIIPAFNEEHSIAYVVEDFRELVDEVFVVDNSSTDRTASIARAAGARVETVKLFGYGDTIRYGLDHATGDILVITEADFSFRARDLNKLLVYLQDADLVVGTRTTRELVEQGANMRGPVRWGNVVVAKGLELLWWDRQPRFTDVGCTYRALWRDTYRSIRPLLDGIGPELSPEMMIAVLQAGKRIVKIPVSYHRRLGGESKHSANYFRISRTALKMLRQIARKRLQRSKPATGAAKLDRSTADRIAAA